MFSKQAAEVLEPLNSICWFLMDFTWAAEVHVASYVLMALTVASGLALAIADRDGIWAQLGLNAWIWLNSLWMLSELLHIEWLRWAALAAAGAGAVLVVIAGLTSRDWQRTFGAFKRLRLHNRRRGSPT